MIIYFFNFLVVWNRGNQTKRRLEENEEPRVESRKYP
jgi:hypothetical protein